MFVRDLDLPLAYIYGIDVEKVGTLALNLGIF
jgi:hypothetical protein